MRPFVDGDAVDELIPCVRERDGVAHRAAFREAKTRRKRLDGAQSARDAAVGHEPDRLADHSSTW